MRYSWRSSRPSRGLAGRIALIVAAAASAVVLIAIAVLVFKWPFSRKAVEERVSRDTGTTVSIRSFRSSLFPPGFTAEGLELRGPGSGVTILTTGTIRVRASYPGLLHEDVKEIDISGFQLNVGSKPSSGHSETSSSSFSVSRFVAQNGSVQIQSAHGGQPFRIRIHNLVLTGIGSSHTKFAINAAAARPTGEFHAEGELGKLTTKSLRMTPVGGRYTVSHLDLGVFGGISGTLDSSGSLGGSLRSVEWNGTADIPDFHVSGSVHRVHLESSYKVSIDPGGGDANLEDIQVSFNRTKILAHGQIANGQDGSGKALRLAARIDSGRVEDLLDLFSRGSRPGMTGPIQLNADIQLPPAPPQFLRRLKLRGDFEITDALFTNPKTQSPVNRLSVSSTEGKKRGERQGSQVAAVLNGTVNDSDGIAELSRISYEAPGVKALLRGDFNLLNTTLRFRGTLATSGKLNDATSGVKSVFLVVAKPFLAIRHDGKDVIVPFTIHGNSGRPVFSPTLSGPAARALHVAQR